MPRHAVALLGMALFGASDPAQAQSPTPPRVALWCVPAVYLEATGIAAACGRPVGPGTSARVKRIADAYFAAVQRLQGAGAAQVVRRRFKQLGGGDGESGPGSCADRLREIGSVLRGIEGQNGENLAQRYEAEAALATEPFKGDCL